MSDRNVGDQCRDGGMSENGTHHEIDKSIGIAYVIGQRIAYENTIHP